MQLAVNNNWSGGWKIEGSEVEERCLITHNYLYLVFIAGAYG